MIVRSIEYVPIVIKCVCGYRIHKMPPHKYDEVLKVDRSSKCSIGVAENGRCIKKEISRRTDRESERERKKERKRKREKGKYVVTVASCSFSSCVILLSFFLLYLVFIPHPCVPFRKRHMRLIGALRSAVVVAVRGYPRTTVRTLWSSTFFRQEDSE